MYANITGENFNVKRGQINEKKKNYRQTCDADGSDAKRLGGQHGAQTDGSRTAYEHPVTHGEAGAAARVQAHGQGLDQCALFETHVVRQPEMYGGVP